MNVIYLLYSLSESTDTTEMMIVVVSLSSRDYSKMINKHDCKYVQFQRVSSSIINIDDRRWNKISISYHQYCWWREIISHTISIDDRGKLMWAFLSRGRITNNNLPYAWSQSYLSTFRLIHTTIYHLSPIRLDNLCLVPFVWRGGISDPAGEGPVSTIQPICANYCVHHHEVEHTWLT